MSNHTPKKIPSTPQYRRHKASGRAVVTLQGKDHYLGPFGSKSSRIEYDRLLGEWLANGRDVAAGRERRCAHDRQIDSEILVVRQVLLFEGWPTDRSADCYQGRSALLRRYYERIPAGDFGPLALQALQSRMIESGLSRSYINGHTGRIKLMFKWAVSQQLLPVTVYQALATVSGLRKGRTAAREPAPIMPVADDVREVTLPFLPPVIADMVKLQRITGCRPGEVCILRPCDVDRGSDIWCYRPSSHKTQHHGARSSHLHWSTRPGNPVALPAATSRGSLLFTGGSRQGSQSTAESVTQDAGSALAVRSQQAQTSPQTRTARYDQVLFLCRSSWLSKSRRAALESKPTPA